MTTEAESESETGSYAGMFRKMGAKEWMQLVVVVCAYTVLRKIALIFVGAKQKRDLEQQNALVRESAEAKTIADGGDGRGGGGDSRGTAARWTARELREMNEQFRASSAATEELFGGGRGGEEEEEEQEDLVSWGRLARRRDRAEIEKKMRVLEEKYKDADSDAEIEEFLVD